LAAKLGYQRIVELLLQDKTGSPALEKEAQRLVKIKNKTECGGKVALDLAVEDGRFPPRKLFLFTNCLDPAAKVDAFVKVAHTCPEAASALLRAGHGEEEEHQLCKDWSESMKHGVKNKLIHVSMLANLVQEAPRAALDFLDVLTVKPEVVCREHNPLPIRAKIPNDYEACRLSCSYEQDAKWFWDPATQGGRPWHSSFAPKDPKRGQEVTIKVVYLPGIADLHLVHGLAETEDHRIFTKLVVHGLLKYVWSNFIWIFAVDLTFQVIALGAICMWIWGIHPQNELMKRNLWCLLTAQSITQCLLFLWSSVVCLVQLGRWFLLRWLSRNWQGLVIGSFTIVLANLMGSDFSPGSGSKMVLALCALMHWVLLLYELRAFQWTGKRIMPIMKSVMPITGMLVIMLFVSLGFMHAFWAMETDMDQVSLFGVVVLLFTGEHFLGPEELRAMDSHNRDLIISLSILGLFVFLTCTINVFIAVLGDCYDQEQERTVCTLLQERARICASLFLRPKLPVARVISAYSWRWRSLCWLGLVLGIAATYILILMASASPYVASWPPVVFLVFSVQLLQCVQSDTMTMGWTERYLWICHEANVDEDDFLAPDERQNVECRGRLARIKSYMLEQCRTVTQRNKMVAATTKGEIIKHLDECLKRVDCCPMPSKAPLPGRWRKAQPSQEARGAEEEEEEGSGLDTAVPGGYPPDIREDLAAVKMNLGKLQEQLNRQCDAQSRLEHTCAAVAQALHQAFELTNSRARSRSCERQVSLRNEAEDAGSSEAPEPRAGAPLELN